MATHVTESASRPRGPPFRRAPPLASTFSVSCCQSSQDLAQLASESTNARGYAAPLAGYGVAELNEAIEALHDAAAENAFGQRPRAAAVPPLVAHARRPTSLRAATCDPGA